MKIYSVDFNGTKLDLQLDDEDAKARGLLVEPEANAEAPAPANTEAPAPDDAAAKAPANKQAAAPATK